MTLYVTVTLVVVLRVRQPLLAKPERSRTLKVTLYHLARFHFHWCTCFYAIDESKLMCFCSLAKTLSFKILWNSVFRNIIFSLLITVCMKNYLTEINISKQNSKLQIKNRAQIHYPRVKKMRKIVVLTFLWYRPLF